MQLLKEIYFPQTRQSKRCNAPLSIPPQQLHVLNHKNPQKFPRRPLTRQVARCSKSHDSAPQNATQQGPVICHWTRRKDFAARHPQVSAANWMTSQQASPVRRGRSARMFLHGLLRQDKTRTL